MEAIAAISVILMFVSVFLPWLSLSMSAGMLFNAELEICPFTEGKATGGVLWITRNIETPPLISDEWSEISGGYVGPVLSLYLLPVSILILFLSLLMPKGWKRERIGALSLFAGILSLFPMIHTWWWIERWAKAPYMDPEATIILSVHYNFRLGFYLAFFGVLLSLMAGIVSLYVSKTKTPTKALTPIQE